MELFSSTEAQPILNQSSITFAMDMQLILDKGVNPQSTAAVQIQMFHFVSESKIVEV